MVLPLNLLISEQLSIIKMYNLNRKISMYPHLQDKMRRTFLEILEEEGIVTEKEIENQAGDWMQREGLPVSEDGIKTYREALIDMYFASLVKKTDDYINLVRKRDRADNLAKILGSDSASLPEVYKALREFCLIPKGEVFISPDYAEGIRVALIRQFISSQLPFIGVAKNHITIRDVDGILEHTVWDHKRFGRLGGKAAGVILANKILLPTLEKHDPEFEEYIRVPDTWYLNSKIFAGFMERHDLYHFRTQKYKDRMEIERDYTVLEKRFRDATFSEESLNAFRDLLKQTGDHPIIVRSSSYLEDSFGLAFSGKYDSVFLANQGDMGSRLSDFIGGVKIVLASMYHTDPILYRRQHGLLDYNEQMAMIVQKVVGRRFGDYFFPLAAGVMFSVNAYRWHPMIRSEDGLLRIVVGLGTRAVDRVGSDYPRMIPLSHPELRPEVKVAKIVKYSQKKVDVINLKKGCFETLYLSTLAGKIDHPDLYFAAACVEDGEVRAPLYRTQSIAGNQLCITFENLIRKSPFIPLIRKVLNRLKEAYNCPVDIEFAWDGDKLYILQCRTLSVRKDIGEVSVPEEIADEDVLFEVHTGLSNCVLRNLEYITCVDPKAYDRIEDYEKKVGVARIVSGINHALHNKRFVLLGPGRWGSSDINLGVPVRYSDINNARLLAEIAYSHDGFTPEVSYGTHFFQDLIEGDIAILPIYPDRDDRFAETFFEKSQNWLPSFLDNGEEFRDIVHVIHIPRETEGKFLHVVLDGATQQGIGYFGSYFEGEE